MNRKIQVDREKLAILYRGLSAEDFGHIVMGYLTALDDLHDAEDKEIIESEDTQSAIVALLMYDDIYNSKNEEDNRR